MWDRIRKIRFKNNGNLAVSENNQIPYRNSGLSESLTSGWDAVLLLDAERISHIPVSLFIGFDIDGKLDESSDFMVFNW